MRQRSGARRRSEDQALVAVVKLFADARAGGRGYAAALGKPPAKTKRT